MYSPHKNSYLQSRTQNINPQIINRCVNLARDQPTIDGSDFEPAYNRLTSEQPHLPSNHLDATRRPLALGRWALAKLRKELHHTDASIVLQAVTSICDLVHDPEKGYESIRLRIPDRMSDLLAHEDPRIRERVCMALTIIAGHGDGRAIIVKNKLSLENIAKLVKDKIEAVRHKTAVLLEMIARTWFAADYLVEAGFIKLIMNNLTKETDLIIISYLDTLLSLMYAEGKHEVLDLDGFNVFVSLMETGKDPLVTKSGDCLMALTSTHPGKDIAYDTQILNRLLRLLHHHNTEIYASVASAIMFCTIKSKSKIRAKEMPQLLDRLLTLMNDWQCRPAQIFCIKALTNMCEHPEIRREVRDKHLDRVEAIFVDGNEDVRRYKDILLTVIKWVPWSAT